MAWARDCVSEMRHGPGRASARCWGAPRVLSANVLYPCEPPHRRPDSSAPYTPGDNALVARADSRSSRLPTGRSPPAAPSGPAGSLTLPPSVTPQPAIGGRADGTPARAAAHGRADSGLGGHHGTDSEAVQHVMGPLLPRRGAARRAHPIRHQADSDRPPETARGQGGGGRHNHRQDRADDLRRGSIGCDRRHEGGSSTSPPSMRS